MVSPARFSLHCCDIDLISPPVLNLAHQGLCSFGPGIVSYQNLGAAAQGSVHEQESSIFIFPVSSASLIPLVLQPQNGEWRLERTH